MSAPALYICGGRGLLHRRVQFCPTCQRNRRFACSFQAWYGTTQVCLGCGDGWEDGEMLPRPFERGWRARSKEKARRWWAEALPYREFRRAFRAEIRSWTEAPK